MKLLDNYTCPRCTNELVIHNNPDNFEKFECCPCCGYSNSYQAVFESLVNIIKNDETEVRYESIINPGFGVFHLERYSGEVESIAFLETPCELDIYRYLKRLKTEKGVSPEVSLLTVFDTENNVLKVLFGSLDVDVIMF